MIDLFDDSFTLTEMAEIIVTGLPYLILYFIIGFGPGLILGILIMNWLAGRGNPTFMDTHEEKAKQASQHNAQWNPKHTRWQK